MSALCPCVRPSVNATTFHGVAQLVRFITQSIAYDPRTLTKEGIFLVHMKIRFNWYLRRAMSRMLDQKERGSFVPSDRFIPSDRWKYACQSSRDDFLHFFIIFRLLFIKDRPRIKRYKSPRFKYFSNLFTKILHLVSIWHVLFESFKKLFLTVD